MTVKTILPDMGSAGTHARRRVAFLAGRKGEARHSSMTKTTRMANRIGIIQFTFMA
jgi:hypothetical protein